MKLKHLLLGRKAMTNLDSELKSIDLILPTKVHLVKAMFFPVVMYGCECWTIKKAERIDAFEQWCWRRLLIHQSILKEISPEYSLEGLMLKLKLQYFGHLMQRADSLEKPLILGRIEGRRRRGHQRMRWLDGITNSFEQAPRDGVGHREAWRTAVYGVAKSRTRLSDWTELRARSMMMLSAPRKCPPDGALHHHTSRGAADTQVSTWIGGASLWEVIAPWGPPPPFGHVCPVEACVRGEVSLFSPFLLIW